MKKLNKFLYITMLELAVVGVVFLIIGLRSGANINMIVDGIKNKCIEIFQWAIQLI